LTPIVEMILAPKTVLGSFLVLFFGGLVFYPITSGTSYVYYCIVRKKRFFAGQERKNERDEVKKEWLWAFYNVLGNAVITAPIHHLVITGASKIYFDVSDRGWGYYFLSVGMILVITEIGVYWAHRILHHPVLYKHIHFYHHQFRVPSPWTSMAFHPLDSFAQALPHHLCAFLFPVHVSIYAFFIIFLQIWSTFIHERVSWVRWGFINYTAHHTLHHKFNKYNYGQFFTVCDRLFGTYKAPLSLVYDGAVPHVPVAQPAKPAAQPPSAVEPAA
jgi:lathosterol oxidase